MEIIIVVVVVGRARTSGTGENIENTNVFVSACKTQLSIRHYPWRSEH